MSPLVPVCRSCGARAQLARPPSSSSSSIPPAHDCARPRPARPAHLICPRAVFLMIALRPASQPAGRRGGKRASKPSSQPPRRARPRTRWVCLGTGKFVARKWHECALASGDRFAACGRRRRRRKPPAPDDFCPGRRALFLLPAFAHNCPRRIVLQMRPRRSKRGPAGAPFAANPFGAQKRARMAERLAGRPEAAAEAAEAAAGGASRALLARRPRVAMRARAGSCASGRPHTRTKR